MCFIAKKEDWVYYILFWSSVFLIISKTFRYCIFAFFPKSLELLKEYTCTFALHICKTSYKSPLHHKDLCWLFCWFSFYRTMTVSRLMNILLPKSFCSLEHFTSKLTLLLNTLYSLTHFNPQHTLLFSTLCTSAHFAPWNTLLPGILCSLEHFTSWNTLLWVFQWAKYVEEDNL